MCIGKLVSEYSLRKFLTDERNSFSDHSPQNWLWPGAGKNCCQAHKKRFKAPQRLERLQAQIQSSPCSDHVLKWRSQSHWAFWFLQFSHVFLPKMDLILCPKKKPRGTNPCSQPLPTLISSTCQMFLAVKTTIQQIKLIVSTRNIFIFSTLA